MMASAQMTSLPQMNHAPTQPQQPTAGANSNVGTTNNPQQSHANNGATAQQQQLPQGFPHFNAMFGGFMPGANFTMMPQQQAAWLTNPALFQQQMFMAQQVAQQQQHQQQQQQMMQHGTTNGSQSQTTSAQVASSNTNTANGETNMGMLTNINPPNGMQASSATGSSHAEV